MTAVAGWWAYVLRYEAREVWRALPGPWWVRVLLVAVCVAIPGPADEIALVAVAGWLRRRKS